MADERFEQYKARLVPEFEAAFAQWRKQLGTLAPEGQWQSAFHSFAFQWYVQGYLDAEIKNASGASAGIQTVR